MTHRMATPRAERTVCPDCRHFHRFVLTGKCRCCRDDYRSMSDADREQARKYE